VVAIGHQEQGGLWTLTTGVISAEVDNFNCVKGKQVFHTETGLNRGNSGGPLLDGEGWMIGVNTAIARVASDGLPITSIGFSLKSSVARPWLREQGVGFELDKGRRCPLDKCSL
jgi:serine protease Do